MSALYFFLYIADIFTVLEISKTSKKPFILHVLDTFSVYQNNRFEEQPPDVFYQKGVLKNFAKFIGKHLCLGPATLLKKRLWYRCFPVSFVKFLRTCILWNTSGRLVEVFNEELRIVISNDYYYNNTL